MPNLRERLQQGRREGREAVEQGRAWDVVKSVSTVWGFYVLSVIVVLAGVAFALTSTGSGAPLAANQKLRTPAEDQVLLNPLATKSTADSVNVVGEEPNYSLQEALSRARIWAFGKAEDAKQEIKEDLQQLRNEFKTHHLPEQKVDMHLKDRVFEKDVAASRKGEAMRHGATVEECKKEFDYLLDSAYWRSRYAAERPEISAEELEAIAEKKVQSLKDDAAVRAREAEFAIMNGLHRIKEFAGEVLEKVEDLGERAKDRVQVSIQNAKDNVRSNLHNAKESVQTTMANAKDTMQTKMHEAKESVQNTVLNAKETVENAFQTGEDKARRAAGRTEEFVADRVDDAAARAHAAAEELRRQGERNL